MTFDMTPFKKFLQGRPLALLGLGVSNTPLALAALDNGIEVIAWDDTAAAREAAAAKNIPVAELTPDRLARSGAICPVPGIAPTHPVLAAARAARLPVIGDIEIFVMCRWPNRAEDPQPPRIIGITGTNGKSTTTALTGHLLDAAGFATAVGGNIGRAVMTLPELPKGGWHVLELSSYQIDLLTDFRPAIAALTNITPDHLERYGDTDSYAASKKRIFDGPGVAVIGTDDALSQDVFIRTRAAGIRRTVVPVSTKRPLITGVFTSPEGILFEGEEKITALAGIPGLPGRHNWQNAAIAYALCRHAGAAPDDLIRGLHSFPGLAHRQNTVATLNGVAYVNDSKATNDDSAAVALATYKSIYWIAGGKSKGAGYDACAKHLKNVTHAFLIGSAAEEMAAFLTSHRVPHTICGTIDKAVAAARRLAEAERKPRATVLLSPACASLDQFRNFEERGDAFVAAVKAHAKKPATEGQSKP